jgi:protocatechuate 3,4-dioxygenase beta subunit
VADSPDRITRRRFLGTAAAVPVGLALASCGDDPAQKARSGAETTTTSGGTTLPATRACPDGDEPTLEQTEGPYFTPRSPARRSLLEPGMQGERLALSGVVLSTECRPVRRALVDFWQADAAGDYDNEGFRLRGHQLTDGQGRYRLATVVPGLYPGRTRHIHVKVQAPGKDVLTTQLYFPGESANEGDGIFDPSLVIDLAGERGTFDFVLDLS